MNSSQKIILVGATVILVCMVVFPPWTLVYQPPKDTGFSKGTRSAGYHLLFSPNTPQDQTQLADLFGLPHNGYTAGRSRFSMEIDSTRLMLQIGGLVVVAALLLFLSKNEARH